MMARLIIGIIVVGVIVLLLSFAWRMTRSALGVKVRRNDPPTGDRAARRRLEQRLRWPR